MLPEVCQQDGKIRSFRINGEWWYSAVDFGNSLGLSNIINSMRNIPEKYKSKLEFEDRRGIPQTANTLNENGLLLLLLRSRKLKTDHPIITSLVEKIYLSPERIMTLMGDVDTDPSTPMYLYAIREPDSTNIKLGISGNPIERIAQLNQGNCRKLELLHCVPAPRGFRSERLAHSEAGEPLLGEWFDIEPLQAIEILDNVAAQHSKN